MHMENARRGVTTSYSEMGKYRPYAKRFGASPKEKHTVSDHDVGPSDYNGYSRTSSNRESITKKKIEEVHIFNIVVNSKFKLLFILA